MRPTKSTRRLSSLVAAGCLLIGTPVPASGSPSSATPSPSPTPTVPAIRAASDLPLAPARSVVELDATGRLSALHVRAHRLVDAKGTVVRLLGVNRSGAEYMCVGPDLRRDMFDGPTSARTIRAMRRWHVNALRLPLNESCWLGINGAPRSFSAASYRHAISSYVQRLNRSGMYVVLDLHWAAPGRHRAAGIIPMADVDHAPDFWRSVARTFKPNHRVLFDLYNEPHDIGWSCWRSGCRLAAGGQGPSRHPAYRTAGMQRLVHAVRSTGATHPILVGGIDWGRRLSGWMQHRVHDPARQLVASEHNYGGLAPCWQRCRAAIVRVARHVPVVVGEVGETDCAHGYVDGWMPWADRHGLSYLGWAWNATAPGGWSCRGGPSLIKDWTGSPTPYGVGLKRHLRQLRR